VSLRSARQELLERSDLHGEAFCSALAAAADEWLSGLLHQATRGDLHGIALVAVGGYGRASLCPYSDLDVVLVHRGRKDVRAVADAVWYPVWDEGIRLDHSVRRPDEVLAVAHDDLRAQLGLLDGRLVVGDPEVTEPMLAKALEQSRKRASHWLPQLDAQVAARHQAHGEVAFLLEPDLKEAHGGLRDVHAVVAAARAVPQLAEYVELSSLDDLGAVLTAARVELHRVTGRATDRLLLQEQDQVAANLGQRDADALMTAIAEAGRTIAWVADDAWRRRALWDKPAARRPWRRTRPGPGRVPAEPGIAVVLTDGAASSGEVVLDPGWDTATDPTLPLRLAAVAAERSLPIGRDALDTVTASASAATTGAEPGGVGAGDVAAGSAGVGTGDPWPAEMRDALVRTLAAGAPAVPALEALDHHGLLTRILPEWAAVRNKPQRNAYHRYTVDRHLLEAAAQASTLAARVQRPDLLLVGALLHDIGKGYPGDHTANGVRVVDAVARRMGFAPADVDVLIGLVRHHLLLAEVATRRDLDDPATVEGVADAVEDEGRLELLAALTQADSIATGPAAWSPWKAGLVAELVRRVDARLKGAEVPAPPSLVTDRHRGFMRQAERLGRSIVVIEPPGVIVVARDRAGLLAAAAGVLALHGLDVRSADVAGERGYAVELFVVESVRGRWPDAKLIGDELDAVLRGSLPLADRLAEQALVYARGQRPTSPEPAVTRVSVDNDASRGSTVIDVRAHDAIGLLHRVTTALFERGLDVVAARVATLGQEVVDAFYVRDAATGSKVTDAERIARMADHVARAIDG
jgi:[protein-PII] uridylyltransferase